MLWITPKAEREALDSSESECFGFLRKPLLFDTIASPCCNHNYPGADRYGLDARVMWGCPVMLRLGVADCSGCGLVLDVRCAPVGLDVR